MNFEITSGKIPTAIKCCVYGPEGIGKSTFASKFPDPLFIDTEGSTKQLSVKRLPAPKDFNELIEEIDFVCKNPTSCKTLVIDTIDWAEKLAITDVCNFHKVNGIEDIGYGKGYTFVADNIQKLLNRLDNVIYYGINVLLTAHAQLRTFYLPDEMGQYDRWELKVTKKSAPIIKEWTDLLLFANYKTIVIKDPKTGKNKGTGNQRVMYTTHNATYDAKNRFNLPEQTDFDYSVIASIFAPEKAVTVSQEILMPTDKEEPKIYEIPAETVEDTPLLTFRKMCEQHGIKDEEVIAYVDTLGMYPAGTKVADYEQDWIEYLVNNFNKFYSKIVEMRDPVGE